MCTSEIAAEGKFYGNLHKAMLLNFLFRDSIKFYEKLEAKTKEFQNRIYSECKNGTAKCI